MIYIDHLTAAAPATNVLQRQPIPELEAMQHKLIYKLLGLVQAGQWSLAGASQIYRVGKRCRNTCPC